MLMGARGVARNVKKKDQKSYQNIEVGEDRVVTLPLYMAMFL